jgi:hypothetical protein
VLPLSTSYQVASTNKGGKPIAVWLHSISSVGTVNILVVFYDIHATNK